MGQQNSAEAIVGDSPVTEGLNIGYESKRVVSMVSLTTARAIRSPNPKREASSRSGTVRLCRISFVTAGASTGTTSRGLVGIAVGLLPSTQV
jgi:hypothetical protein